MSRARYRKPAPLPVRDGLNPTRVRVGADGPGELAGPISALAYLAGRFPPDAGRLAELLAAGEVVDEWGRSIGPETVVEPGDTLYLYRDPPDDEVAVPFEIDVLYEDDDIIVVDKPHFLAVTPRGSHVKQTVLVRLRQRTGLTELSPVHRLDRATAGVLMLAKRSALRRPYQLLFQERQVHKVYEAVAPLRHDLGFPVTVRSRIRKERGIVAAFEEAGPPNAETRVELVGPARGGPRPPGDGGGLGLYRLEPLTGKTHQLRVHMNALGIPIACDDLFPAVIATDPGDFSRPLQLVARSLRFVDPISGQSREFTSRRRLAWA